MTEMWWRKPTAYDLYHLARNMRPDDANEISLMAETSNPDDFAARTFSMLPFSVYSAVFGVDMAPDAIAFMGVWPMNEHKTLCTAALFATGEFPILAGKFVRHLRRFVAPVMLANGVRRIECRTLASYTAAHRLLRALGAVEETGPEGSPDYGPNGESFKLFAMRRRDWEGRV